MPLVSVVIPTFNRPRLVQEAIDSVLAQQGAFDFEIVVVDDGSTPETEQALQKYSGAIRYVKRANAGLNPSRNHALGLVNGEYVALLDDDDVWLPFKTQLQLAALARYPNAAFAHSNFYIWKPGIAQQADGLRTWFPRPYEWRELYSEHAQVELRELSATYDAYCGDIYYWSLLAPMVLPSTAIVRRAALAGNVRVPEFDSTGDWEFFARLSKGASGVFISAETTLNRSHEDATRLTRTDSAIRLRRRIAMIHRVWRQDAEFVEAHRRQIDMVEARCWRTLAKMCIGRGQSADARAALRELRRLDAGLHPQDWALAALAWTPFSNRLVDLAHGVRALTSAKRSKHKE